MTGTRRIQLGFYMYTPRLGGAEGYLRDLLWGVDRKRFDVILFAPRWAAFDRFLGLGDAPPVKRVEVGAFEPGTPRHLDTGSGPDDVDRDYGREAPPSRLRVLAKRVPFGPKLAPGAQWALRQAYWSPDVRYLARTFSVHGLDVLHSVNGGYPGSTSSRAAMPAAARLGTPRRILTVCSTPMPRTGIPGIERHLDSRVDAASTGVIVPATRPLEALVGLRGFSPAKVHVVPWGIDAPPAPADRRAAKLAARQLFGIHGPGPVIGTLGNFTPTKGQADVVDAVAQIRPRFPEVLCLVAGEGPERSNVEARSRALGLDDAVRFPGRMESAFAFLRALDVFILASGIEGLPLVVLEAMSQGVPVVATDVGGIPDAVLPGVTGYLVPPRDPAAIADAVSRILSAPEAADAMAVEARAMFERRFSLPVMLGAHESLYAGPQG